MFRRGELLGSQPPAGKEEPPAAREKRPPEITGSKGRASEIRSRETQSSVKFTKEPAKTPRIDREKKRRVRMDGTVQGEKDRDSCSQQAHRPLAHLQRPYEASGAAKL
jgi:hypothetical protein